MKKNKAVIALALLMGITGGAIASPHQAAATQKRDVVREKAERSAEWHKRQARLTANSKRAAAERAEDKTEWRAREARIAQSKVRAAKNRAQDKAVWKRVSAHRAAEAKRLAAARN